MSSNDAAPDSVSPLDELAMLPPLQAFGESLSQAAGGRGEVVYLWMSRQEICDHLAVPPHTLYRMVQRGEVACNREGDDLRYRPVNIDLGLADLEARAERAAETAPAVSGAAYLSALVELVDGLTERLVKAERGQARADQARRDAVSVARRTTDESSVLVRQLKAYCQSLVESNTALTESNAQRRELAKQLADLRSELLELAGSPLSLPVRTRLLGLAERSC